MGTLLQGGLFLAGLLSAAWTDLRRREIYDLSSIAVALAGLISFSPARLLGAVLAAPFLLASVKGRGGAGDTLLIAACGVCLGLRRGGLGLMLALMLFLCLYGAAWLWRKVRAQPPPPETWPLAPFLAAGFLTAYFI